MAARGLVIVLPLLIAAGVAIYESPQVRQFLDEHRRKLSVALNDLGDQFGAPSEGGSSQRPPMRQRNSRDAPSAREDASPEAEARRRRAREEIAERRRIMEEKRGIRRGSSFDDMVDAEGNLRGSAATGRDSTGLEMGVLRRRHNESAGAAAGSAFANPFSDEMQVDQEEHEHGLGLSDEELARKLQAQYDEEYASSQRRVDRPWEDDTPLTQQEIQELERIVREEAERQGRELPEPGDDIRLSDSELLHNLNHLRAELVDLDPESSDNSSNHKHARPLTPTTQSTWTRTLPGTPPSEATAASHSLSGEGVLVDAADSTQPSDTPLIDLTPTTSAPGTPRQAVRQATHQQSYQSIQDWAEQSTASFHSLYDSSVGTGERSVQHHHNSSSTDRSDLDSISALSESSSNGNANDLDLISEPGISTPGTWTEVGSVVSSEADDRHGHHEGAHQPLHH